MDTKKMEFYVGLFVVIGMICCIYLFVSLGEIGFNQEKRYPVYGYFTSVSGLKKGAIVEMAGVEIGVVSDISLDKEQLMAKVEFSIDKGISLSEDVIASVKTAGIIGQKYIDIALGRIWEAPSGLDRYLWILLNRLILNYDIYIDGIPLKLINIPFAALLIMVLWRIFKDKRIFLIPVILPYLAILSIKNLRDIPIFLLSALSVYLFHHPKPSRNHYLYYLLCLIQGFHY